MKTHSIYPSWAVMFFVLFLQFNGSAQNHRIDSVKLRLKNAKSDTARANSLNGLASELKEFDLDTAFLLCQQALNLSQMVNYDFGKAIALNRIGYFYTLKTEIRKALSYYQKALPLWMKLEKQFPNNHDVQKRKMMTLNNFGHTYKHLERYDSAIFSFLEAIKIAKIINDKASVINFNWGLFEVYTKNSDHKKQLSHLRNMLNAGDTSDLTYKAEILGSIAGVYSNIGDYSNALEYSMRSLAISKKIKDKYLESSELNRIGLIYLRTKEPVKALDYLKKSVQVSTFRRDTGMIVAGLMNIGCVYYDIDDLNNASLYFDRCLQITKQLKKPGDIGSTLGNIGLVYLKKGDLSKAKESYETAIKLLEGSDLKSAYALNVSNLGELYTKLGKFNEAEQFLNRACLLAKRSCNLEEQREIYERVYKNYEAWGKYKPAYEYYRKVIGIKDSIALDEFSKKQLSQDLQKEFEETTSENMILQAKKDGETKAELSRQKFLRNTFIAGLILLLLFFAVVIRQNRKIAKAKLRAEQSEQFKQQFLANMSHEIRTPMNAVMGMTNLLLDKDPKKEQLKYLQGIVKSSDNLLHIINDILDLSKIEAGKIDLEQIDFSARDVIDQVSQTLQHKAEEKGLQLLVNIDPSIPPALIGDPVRLNQVLMNLTGNAIKFTEKGSVELNVKLIEDKIKFSVIDTGIGIPKDKLSSVFESFSQANSSDTRKFGGTGLGLSISKQLVELHGSNIEIESEQGKGSCFSFTLSYPIGSVDKIEKAGNDKIDGSLLDGLRILLADDNEMNRMVANDTLTSKSKVHIDEVSNGQEAVDALMKNDYDVILMDVQMPVMDGY